MIINFSNIGSGSGSGGVTTGEVATMITNLAQGYYTANTLSAITSPKEGDVCVISEEVSEIEYTSEQNSFWDVVPGKKVRVELDTEGLTNNLIKYTVNNSLYFGWGYMESSKNKANESTGNWEAWTAQTFDITFPSEITSHTRTESSSRTALLQNTTLYLVEENVLYTYMGGEWIKLFDTIQEIAQEIVNQSVGELYSIAQTEETADWSGYTPSDFGGVIEGTILNNNGAYGEAFNGEDAFLERKGFYNRTFTGTTDLSATTGNEGDIYTKITQTTGETAWTAMSAEEFAATCSGNTGWEAGVTYKFVADTAVTPASEGQFAYNISNVIFGIGYKDGAYVKWDDNQEENNWVAWDGSEIIVSIPDPVTSRSNKWRNNAANVATFVTASTLETQITTTVDSYEMIYGEWCPRYKHVVMSQGDYESLQSKDTHTIYNITGTTS